MLNARRESTFLVAIALLAAALRLASIDFAPLVPRARPDEEFVSGRALAMVRSFDPNPHFFHYPSLLIYANAFLLWILPGSQDEAGARLVSRLLSAACGLLEVLLVARLGSRWFSPRVGLAAAGFVAVAYLHVREAHFGTPGAAMSMLVTLSLLLAERARAQARPRLLRAAGAVAGLAASVKYPGVLALVPVLASGALLADSWRTKLREMGFACLLAALCFGVTSPFLLLDPAGARASLGEMTSEVWGEAAPPERQPLFPLTFSLRYGLGIALLSLALSGLAALAGRRAGWLLLSWAAPFYLAAALTPIVFSRYALPLVPPLALAAAALVDRLPVGARLKAALLLLTVLEPLLRSIAFDVRLGREDTRASAYRWIAENLPAGAGVMVSEGYGAPPVPESSPLRPVRSRLAAVREGESEGFAYLVTHEHPVLTRFSRVDPSLRRRLAEADKLAEFDPFRGSTPTGVYDPYDAFYLPFADFSAVERPGPRIAVWRLTGPE
jgi:4-amino-4-deoxy-L-arabinose transferase-like glycosyltransferase